MNEMVILVNEQDQVVGYEEKLRAHELGLLHRAFSIFLLRLNARQEIEVLLQQREQSKYHCGGLWTNTCCSHPRPNEDLLAAAKRRLVDELRLTADLQYLDSFIYRAEFSNGLIEHEYDHVFVGNIDAENIDFNSAEVQACKWVAWEKFLDDLKHNPASYTPWLSAATNIINQKLPELNQILFKEPVC